MAIETVRPGKGEVAFVWFNNYSGVTIKTPGRTLVIDPVNVDPRPFTSVDAVLITHEHYDHLDQAVVRDVQKRTGCVVVADPASSRRLRSVVGPDKLREVNVGDEVEIDGVKVKVRKCKHPAAAPVTFLITSEEGVKVYHTADSLPFPEMKLIGEEEKPDLVFCTVGIAPGASPRSGVEIAKMIQPKVAIPYHTASRGDIDRFAELLAKEAPQVRCMTIERRRPYRYP